MNAMGNGQGTGSGYGPIIVRSADNLPWPFGDLADGVSPTDVFDYITEITGNDLSSYKPCYPGPTDPTDPTDPSSSPAPMPLFCDPMMGMCCPPSYMCEEVAPMPGSARAVAPARTRARAT